MATRAWVQEALFPVEPPAPTKADSPAPSRRRLSYTRVTRDAAAALSYAESRLVAAQVTHGFAAAFGRLSPERQAALRALFAGQPRSHRPA